MHGHHNHHDHHQHMVADFKRRFWVSLALTLPIVMLSPMIGFVHFAGDAYVSFALSSIVFVYGGWPFLTGLVSELRRALPGMMTLVAVAISTAYVYSSATVFGLPGEGFFWELATLIDIMLVGHWIEMRSVMGASKALESLVRLMPSQAHQIALDGSVRDVAIAALKLGDKVLVKPGEKIPVDGIVLEGTSTVDESMLTGESMPVAKSAQKTVTGGSINGEGSLTVQVQKLGKDSYLSQVIELVRQAQSSKSKTQNLADRAALWLTIIALVGGALTLLAWLALTGQTFAFSIERAVTVMVIACPHALGLAIPLVVAVSTAIAAKNGLLIRDRTAFEQARSVDAIVLDKTGTLTLGRFGITAVHMLQDALSESELLSYAGAVESNSQHPIARAIASAATPLAVENFQSLPGQGAVGIVKGKKVHVVSAGYLAQEHIAVPKWEAGAATVVYVLVDNQLAGVIALSDVVRPESKAAIKQLQGMGLRCIMLTGDNKQVAQQVALELGLDEVIAEVLPHQKVAAIKAIQSRGLRVAMTGDGVNDAPALAQADVGIAIGAGTDVAIQSADIILVRSNPGDIASVIGLSRATFRKMGQNLLWATGYNVVAMPLAAGVLYNFGIVLSPAVGAVLMGVSTVVVAINARMLSLKR